MRPPKRDGNRPTVRFATAKLTAGCRFPPTHSSYQCPAKGQIESALQRKRSKNVSITMKSLHLAPSRLAKIGLAIAVCLAAANGAYAQNDATSSANASAAFNKLKTLAGHWEANTSKGKASATYQLVSGGTALLENTNMPGETEMISVYYLDGDRLLLTHYCEAGNQPRLQADGIDAANAIDFRFLDATNLANPAAGHMHHVVFKFQGANEVAQDWTFYKDGKPGFTVPVDWHRVE